MIDAELLAAMLANPAGAQQRFRAMIGERAAQDERFAALAQLLPRADAATPGRAPPRTEMGRIRARVGAMRDDLVAKTQRNRMLADALGACGRCWGTDAACADCAGAGMSGWRAPDATLFQDLVAPALARLAKQDVG